jgi:DNA polymerase-4
VTRARTVSEATNDHAIVRRVALELLREYAPPRPVRLIGVRVASFDHGAPQPRPEGQLALPV